MGEVERMGMGWGRISLKVQEIKRKQEIKMATSVDFIHISLKSRGAKRLKML